MIRIASRITFLLQIALFLVLGEYDRCVNAQSSISGVVRVGGGILPVADAVVVLDRDADPTLVDHLTESDSFGLFSFDEVISGAYTLRVSRPGFQLFEQPVQVIEGLQIEVGVSVEPLAEPSFDLFVDVSGVVSSLNLSSVPLVVSQFRSQTDAAPIQTWERMTDAQGSMELLGMTVGFYQFEVNSGPQARPKWFSYTTATNGFAKRRLDRDSQVMMLLEPDGADLQVQVTGFNPQLGQDSVLTNILVDLAGVSFTDHDAVVIPNRTGETYHLGQETFTNLPAIPWRLRAKRFGYEMSEIVVQPGADGTLPKQVSVSMNLENTGIDVVLDSPFTNRELKNRNKDVSGRFHDGLFLVLEGLPNSNTAGITRFSEAVYDEDREEPVARFRQLLPGNYRVFVPQGSGAISPYVYAKDGRDTQLFVGFTGSDVVDAVLGTISEATLIVEPIPAVVRGRLMVADERGLAGKPVFQPRAEKGIHFSEYEFAEMFDDEVSLQVASDSLGQFTMELPPGFYGVTLPNMTNYFGSRVHVTSSSDPTDTDRQGWPYAEPFLKDDRPVWSFHHGLGMPLSSGQEYEVVLFVRKQVAHVEGSLAADFDDRLRDLVLSWPNVTRRYMDLADAGNAFLKLGDGSGVTLISPLESSVGENRAFFDFPAVPPGTHTLVFSHPRNETPTETVEIPAWDAPGVKPTRDPLDFSEKFPFDTWSLEALGATSVGDDLPAINVESWTGSSYRNLGSIKVPTVLELVSRPGRFYVSDFRSSNFKWPKEPVHYWINVNSQWHAGTYTPGTALPSTVFVGGPDNTFSPDGPGFSGYDLTYRAYSLSDTTMGVDAVDIKTDSNQDIKILASANPGLPVGTVVKTGFEGEFSPNTVVNGAGWVWEEFE
ncbi:MAG: carboxypeptidase regulatory-like domain-containing protein, partial [Verrucomicrobia bacterium]|nr:carboxypeptidase regulatory-like domain-containing protein [Verrucomicrobiota bacterium]